MARRRRERPERRRARHYHRLHARHRRKPALGLGKLFGFAGGQLLTLSAGSGTIEGVKSVVAMGPSEVARQEIAGITGYDIQTKGWSIDNAMRFWLPQVAGYGFDWAVKKFVPELARKTVSLPMIGKVKL